MDAWLEVNPIILRLIESILTRFALVQSIIYRFDSASVKKIVIRLQSDGLNLQA